MRRLLELDERPDAIFAAGDEMAIGAIRAITEAGLKVPEDIAVVGFDDIELAALVQPGLTTVAQDKGGFGTAAATALIAMIDAPATVSPPPSVWCCPQPGHPGNDLDPAEDVTLKGRLDTLVPVDVYAR